jgi:hypothetical protein
MITVVLGRGARFRVNASLHFSLRGGLRALDLAFSFTVPSLLADLWALDGLRRDLSAQCICLLGHHDRL